MVSASFIQILAWALSSCKIRSQGYGALGQLFTYMRSLNILHCKDRNMYNTLVHAFYHLTIWWAVMSLLLGAITVKQIFTSLQSPLKRVNKNKRYISHAIFCCRIVWIRGCDIMKYVIRSPFLLVSSLFRDRIYLQILFLSERNVPRT